MVTTSSAPPFGGLPGPAPYGIQRARETPCSVGVAGSSTAPNRSKRVCRPASVSIFKVESFSHEIRRRPLEDDPSALAQGRRDHFNADRDPLALVLHGGEHLAVFADHEIDNLARRELVDAEA